MAAATGMIERLERVGAAAGRSTGTPSYHASEMVLSSNAGKLDDLRH
jgi:hypothetical protein